MKIEEWLGYENQIGIDIWHKKYQNNDETFDEWIKRVSGGNADVAKLIEDKKFLFGGRILAGRGVEENGRKVSLSNCFTPDNIVKTIHGYKKIQDVVKGELVQTSDGQYNPVNELMTRKYDGDVYKINNTMLPHPIIATGNHKFLTENDEWITIEDIYTHSQNPKKRKYKIATLNPKLEVIEENIDILPIAKKIETTWTKNRTVKYDNDFIWTECEYTGGNNAIGHRLSGKIPRYLTIDNDFLYLLGRYLGDGSLSYRGDTLSIFQIVFNAEAEVPSYEHCKSILDKKFGALSYDNSNSNQGTKVIKLDGILVGAIIEYFCGHKESKHFPEKYKNNLSIALGLLDSDGLIDSEQCVRICLKSEQLIFDLYNNLLNNNIIAENPQYILQSDKIHHTYKLQLRKSQSAKLIPLMNKYYQDGRELAIDKNSRYFSFTDDKTYVLFTKPDIEKIHYEGLVYNLSVENDHSYIVSGLVAHNCYVVDRPHDNLESIFDCAKRMARTYSYGGGCGTDLSLLSPKGAKVRNAARSTSGATSWMDLYSTTTESVCQEGRRGALMLTLNCDHPDIEEFIDIKKDLDRVTKANISVKFNNKFMEAAKQHKKITASFTREATGEVIEKEIDPAWLLYRLAKNNWEMAEPGALFWDRITRYNLQSNNSEYKITSTNPCGEQPLPDGGACLLGSLNLAAFVTDGYFDYLGFEEAVAIAVRALNEVLDEGIPLHPLQKQRDMARDWRNIGLGVMGFADALIKLGFTYGSDDCIEFIHDVGSTMARAAVEESNYLAFKHGAFPKCERGAIVESEFIQHIGLDSDVIKDILQMGLRNCALLTIAPTGSLATMLGVSGGIEPIFANSYTRKTESLNGSADPVYYKVYTPIVQEYLDTHPGKEEKDLPSWFVTAHEIDWHDRITVQGAWQEYIDASISSTVNLPNDASVNDIYKLYMMAWEKGLKGVTIYRDGCARTGILTTEEPREEKVIEGLARGEVIPTADNLIGLKRKLMTGCGSLHCSAFFDPDSGELREIYLSKGSTGGCNNFMIGLSRMISAAARAGVSIDDIIDQLMSTGACPSYAKRQNTSKGSCCPMAVGFALKEMCEEFNKGGIKISPKKEAPAPASTSAEAPKCPDCGEPLYFEGGCNICKSCGWSKCS